MQRMMAGRASICLIFFIMLIPISMPEKSVTHATLDEKGILPAKVFVWCNGNNMEIEGRMREQFTFWL